MSDPIAAWRAEHDNFARLLDLFDREVARFRAGEHPDYELMLDVLTYLRQFARLARHDATVEPLVNRFLQEHRVIAEAAREAQALLEAVEGDEFVARDRVEAACATLLVYYRHHIAGENGLILPLAAQHLKPEDWRAVGAAGATEPDPLFGAQVDARYRELRERIEAEARG
jgi:hemerythrin-like domain-containing protein